MTGRCLRLSVWAVLLVVAANVSAEAGRAAAPVRCDTRSAKGPIVLPWKSFSPDPAYHGQWLVAGDLDGDGVAEIVTARNQGQCVTAAVASRLDGTVLWRWGKANAGSQGLSYDVPLQVYDLDGDGKAEVYLSIKGFLLVLDGKSGKELRRLPLPKGLAVADCITFVNLRGGKRPRDIIVKDRYRRLWAYSENWKPLWQWRSPKYRTSHHPTPVDIDADGKDEIIAGYALLDDDGKELWTLSSPKVKLAAGHVDCSEVMKAARKPENSRVLFTYCGANGIAMATGAGKVLWELAGHHFESADFGPIRRDRAGDEIVVDIDHLPFGKSHVWLLDSRGNLLVDFQCDYGRHHRLIDWNGDGLMEILLGNSRKLFSGVGKCVAHFGPAGAFAKVSATARGNDPGPLAAVGDLDGDRRPEVILHSTKTIHIYKSDKATKTPAGPVGTGVNFTLY